MIRRNNHPLLEIIFHRIVERVLRSIPKKFDSVIVAIVESRDLTQLTLANMFGSLKVHEDRLKKNEEL